MDSHVTKKSYSQFCEDLVLIKFFGTDFKGVFVEVGANDGVRGSNTKLLELNGWRGFLIEPNQRLAEMCRVARPNSVVIEKAAVSEAQVGVIDFFEYRGEHSNGDDYDGLSRVGQPSELEHLALNGGASRRVVPVVATTLDRILEAEKYQGKIDFVSIDVEGHELDVLTGFSLEIYNPRLLLVEDNSFGMNQAVLRHLRSRGYFRVHRTGVNDWFVRDSDRQAFRHLFLFFVFNILKYRTTIGLSKLKSLVKRVIFRDRT
jgi:FkbM family methyltransferase